MRGQEGIWTYVSSMEGYLDPSCKVGWEYLYFYFNEVGGKVTFLEYVWTLKRVEELWNSLCKKSDRELISEELKDFKEAMSFQPKLNSRQSWVWQKSFL